MIDIELEKTILGSCFYPEAVGDIFSVVSTEDFKVETHKRIFDVMQQIVSDGAVPDPVIIHSIDGKISASYLAEVVDHVFTVANVGFYIKKFSEYAEKNRYLAMAASINADKTIEEIRTEVDSVFRSKQSNSEHVGKALKRAFDAMEESYNNRGRISGIETGITRIDEELSGLHKTDMVVIAARPSIGKTALALQIAEHACVNMEVPTLFISLEMSSEQLASRMVLSRSKINVSKARNGLFLEHEWPKMTMSAGEINNSKFYIDDCSGVTIETIVAKAKAAKMKQDIGLVVIDYLGLVAGKGTEYEKITNASQKVKILAKQLNIPVVALHQLNRSNLNGRPTMNELRSSGQIEQDADVIILLHREKKDPVENCELIIEKNRHGKTGIIPQTWNGPINRIEERD